MENQILIALKNNKLLKNITFESLNLTSIKGNLLTVGEGEILFREGEKSNNIYLLIGGEVNLLKKRNVGKAVSLIFADNDFFGCDEFVENTVRESTAVALRDSYIISLSKDEVDSLINQSDEILTNIYEMISLYDIPAKETSLNPTDQFNTTFISDQLTNNDSSENNNIKDDNIEDELLIDNQFVTSESTFVETTELDLKEIENTEQNENKLNTIVESDSSINNFGTDTELETETEAGSEIVEESETEKGFEIEAELELENELEKETEEGSEAVEELERKTETETEGEFEPEELEMETKNPEEVELQDSNEEFIEKFIEDESQFIFPSGPVAENMDIPDTEIILEYPENSGIEWNIPPESGELITDINLADRVGQIEPFYANNVEPDEKTNIVFDKELQEIKNLGDNEEANKPNYNSELKGGGAMSDNNIDNEESELGNSFEENNSNDLHESEKEKTKMQLNDYAESEQTVDLLQKINRAAAILNSNIKIDDVLKNIVNVAMELTNADRGTLYLVDREKNELWSKVSLGNEYKEIKLIIGEGIAGWVAEKGEVINIANVQEDPRFNDSYDKSSGYVTKSMLCFPIKNKNEDIVGVLQLLNNAHGKFTLLDEEFLESLSIHAALALQNAELVEQLLTTERISSLGKMANFLMQDIKKPILVSKRYAEHLKTKITQDDTTRVVDMLLDQLNHIVDLVQATSSYSEGQIVLRSLITKLNGTLDDFITRIDSLVRTNNCEIKKEYDKDVNVKLSEKQFYQCFQHIVKNACDAMPEGGTIYLSTKYDDDKVHITIKDTGLGIPESLHEKIFEPFMSHGKKEATGLGLSITKKIIEEHGGTIKVKSVIGEGASFIISFPVIHTV
ncbi:MAG: GAF domain-containing protein [Bacteroidetes bacterium]|nr:GAF domain-containing protein [Bacteroidota bacterium]